MSSLTRVVLSQLTPPAQRGNVLARERLDDALKQALHYPLSIVCAGTGYGKTTSILGFVSKLDIPVFWYSISPAERDPPKLFLANFFTAFNRGEYKFGQTALRLLLDSDAEGREAIIALVNALSEGLVSKALLVLDDFQSVEESDEIMKLIDWFINHLPANLHVLIASRIPLSFPSMSRWQAQGSLFEIGRDTLSFLWVRSRTCSTKSTKSSWSHRMCANYITEPKAGRLPCKLFGIICVRILKGN